MQRSNIEPINYHDFELYQAFCALQKKLLRQAELFYTLYDKCKCKSCKLNLLNASLEIIEVNEIVKNFESILPPELKEIFEKEAIQFSQTELGIISINAPL